MSMPDSSSWKFLILFLHFGQLSELLFLGLGKSPFSFVQGIIPTVPKRKVKSIVGLPQISQAHKRYHERFAKPTLRPQTWWWMLWWTIPLPNNRPHIPNGLYGSERPAWSSTALMVAIVKKTVDSVSVSPTRSAERKDPRMSLKKPSAGWLYDAAKL